MNIVLPTQVWIGAHYAHSIVVVPSIAQKLYGMHSKPCKIVFHQEQVLFMNTVLSDCLPTLPRRPRKLYIMLLAHMPEQDNDVTLPHSHWSVGK